MTEVNITSAIEAELARVAEQVEEWRRIQTDAKGQFDRAASQLVYLQGQTDLLRSLIKQATPANEVPTPDPVPTFEVSAPKRPRSRK